MKKIILLFLFTSFTTNIYSQIANEHQVAFLPQGFALQTLSSLGTSNIINDISNISSINPASINEFNKISCGISYLFQSKIDEAYIAGIAHNRIQNFTPQSFGILFPFNELKIGIGMRQRYNSELDLGQIQITTMERPDGTGEYFLPIYRTNVHSYSFILSYLFDNFLSQGNEFSLGFKLDYNRLHEYEEIWRMSNDIVANSFGWSAGFIYKIGKEDKKALKLGLSYESSVEFSKYFTYGNSQLNLVPLDSNNRNTTYYAIINPNYLLKGNIPGELKFDFNINPVSTLNFCTSVNYIFWNSITDNFNNQFEFAENIIFSPNKRISASAGIYTTGRKFKQDYFGINNELHAFFLSAGIKFNFNYFDVNLALADSHLLSGEAYKQTIAAFGIGFQI